MKKLICIISVIVFISFLIPIIFVTKFEFKQANTNVLEDDIINEYEYKQYGTIKLFHKNINEIEEIPIDEYLYNVVSAEMPASFSEEALKAQGLVARTYTIYKIKNNINKHEGADICDDSTCCQAWINKDDRFSRWESDKAQEYWDKIVKCVNETKGKIITYEGEPINAFFHSNSGGTTEIPLDVWGRRWISIFASSNDFRRRCIFSILF